MILPTLYKRGNNGAILQWTIEVIGDSYVTRSGQVGGAITETKPTFCKGKNLTKKNETTGEQQAIVEAQAKWDKQIKSKYHEDISRIDTISYISPTLAKPFKDRKKPVIYPAFIQIKYNGVCCIIDKEFGARTRTGEVFHNIRHIVGELKKFFEDNPDVVLHGELFNEDLKENLNRLIELVAVTRKDKDLTPDLIVASEEIVRFYVYDGYIKGKESDPYWKRIDDIHKRITGVKYLVPVPTHVVHNEDEIYDFFDARAAEGHEGAILRIKNMPYVHKRTADICKFKVSETEEFLCTGFLEGTGDWAGIAKKAVMILPNGKTLNCNMKGTREFLKEVFENQAKYTGKKYITEFQCWSEYGIPQIAYTGLKIRDWE